MSALRAHHQGEGNKTRRISEAERLRDSLHYINERGLPFDSYLSKMQKMFTLFEQNKEPYSNAMKLRFLYDTISREAAPGALKGEKDWTRYSEAFENQLNTLYGTLGVPLTYVI